MQPSILQVSLTTSVPTLRECFHSYYQPNSSVDEIRRSHLSEMTYIENEHNEYVFNNGENIDGPLLHRIEGAAKDILIQKDDQGLLSAEETCNALKGMLFTTQVRMAEELARVVDKAGFPNASFVNIRLTTDKESWAIITRHPQSPLKYEKSGTLESCGRIGLYNLMLSFRQLDCKDAADIFEQRYKASLKRVSIIKIVLSIFFPLAPLIILIISLFRMAVINKIHKEYQKTNRIVPEDQIDAVMQRRSELTIKYRKAAEGLTFFNPGRAQLLARR